MRRNNRRQGAPVLVIAVILLILIAAFGISIYRQKFEGSKERVDLKEYLELAAGQDVYTLLNNARADFLCRNIDGRTYVEIGTAKQYLNDRFYYGSADDAVFYCFPDGFYRVSPGESVLHALGEGTSLQDKTLAYMPVVRQEDGLFLAMEWIAEVTDLTYAEFTDPFRIKITSDYTPVSAADVNKKGSLRVSGGIKSEVIRNLERGERVTVIDRMDTWSKVMTEDCFLGYIENSRLSDMYTYEPPRSLVYTEPVFTQHKPDGKICMVWNSLSVPEANPFIYDMLSYAAPVNTVSPTWFDTADAEGNFTDISSADYVRGMHDRGILVWPMVSNFTSGTVRQDFLCSYASRANAISFLIRRIKELGADGINLDFENIDAEYGDDYIEFVRELSAACRNNALTLSVDNYVPYNFNDHYRIDEQGVFCDYVVIMGYDEHYAGSAEPGSVASIDYVRYGIEKTLEEVPADKVINAVPFYTRIWKASSSSGLTSSAVGMQAAAEYIANNGLEVFWDETTCQNYAQGSTNDGYYARIWLEDADSLSIKARVMQQNGLTGIAAWRLGLESSDIWSVFADYMNGN
ncbi:MAG: chitinase [Lachnospiraceae bacterium]|nr:chitinase [Lachnospiraceae bacterium]